MVSLGTTETSTTVNLTDEVVVKLCRLISKLEQLEELELNFKHRLSITNESVSALMDALGKKQGMKNVVLFVEGTNVEALYARQFEKMLKNICKIPSVLVVV